jgi:phosphoribosylanthranilate isomerase
VRSRVKICGLTRLDDALAGVEAGTDALGFMLYSRSPRAVTPEQVRAITRALPPFVARVGVFVDASAEEIRAAIRVAGLDTLQLHGAETPEFCAQFDLPVIKAFRVADESVLAELPKYAVAAHLLDAWSPAAHGGTGTTFNWAIARAAVAAGHRVVLAGGLTPDNVARALAEVRPFGVDVSSGVESAPGRKDPAKLRAFCAAVRAA